MSVTDLPEARNALARRDPAALVGTPECGWLDVKRDVYPLNTPQGAEELAKDVAAFANTATGGLLAVGYATRKEHDEEIVDELRPVPRKVVDLDQHRKIIRQRVIPAPRNVEVGWVPYGDGDGGVLFIHIPAQPPSSLPFVVPAPTGITRVSVTQGSSADPRS